MSLLNIPGSGMESVLPPNNEIYDRRYHFVNYFFIFASTKWKKEKINAYKKLPRAAQNFFLLLIQDFKMFFKFFNFPKRKLK